MPCFRPLDAWRSKDGPIVFSPGGAVGLCFQLPCGQCVGCRLERSRQWAVRCVHEASLYEDNCYITLTYDDDHLPSDGSLNKKHFQDFMKRLRSRFSEQRIRFFHAGEYGEKFRRPHYHACLFNFDFQDKKLLERNDYGPLYTSDVLASIWKLGFCSVGAVTFESAAYVARYILKKITGGAAAEHYIGCDVITGELVELAPEYTTMSRRPGIGSGFFERFRSDIFPRDEVVIRGRLCKPPRFYDRLYERQNPEDFADVKMARLHVHLNDCTPERLRVREICQEAKMSIFHRRGDHEV